MLVTFSDFHAILFFVIIRLNEGKFIILININIIKKQKYMLGGAHNLLTACAMPPNNQFFFFFMLLESSWYPLLIGAMCDGVGEIVCHQRYFFLLSLSSPLNIYVGHSKSQSCSLICGDFNLSLYSFDF